MSADAWPRRLGAGSISRRRFVGGAATVGVAAAAAGLVGCSSSNNKNTTTKPAASASAAASIVAPGAPATRAGAPASATAASRTPTPAALDSTQGKPGGTLVMQGNSYPASMALVTSKSAASTKLGGMMHSGLLSFNFGHPPSNGIDIAAEPDLATALPEQPDDVTYTYKLRSGVKFQNGRAVTADDVKYSLERFASNISAAVSVYLWLDSVQTPDPQTVVVKSKGPFADAILSLAAYNDAFILAKEFEESPDSASKMMGSGPFIYVSSTAPVSISVKKNPDYYLKPYPYFDQVTVLGNTDTAKQVADFVSKQVHVTYWQSEEPRDQMKKGRPDAKVWPYPAGGWLVWMRVDQQPFMDMRVRQALSMALDRKAIRDAVSKGEGEPDQLLSIANGPAWGFRKPADLGDAAKFYTFDLQSAKQLLAAAGMTQPLESQLTHTSSLGQAFVDGATLVQAQWKQAGIATIKDNLVQSPQFSSTALVGDYDGMAFNPAIQQPLMNSEIKNNFWSPPEGVKPPTKNVNHVNNPQLSALCEKELSQLNAGDRKQTLRAIEDLLAVQMYRIPLSTVSNTWFSDPSLRNNVVPQWGGQGSGNYLKYWWFA